MNEKVKGLVDYEVAEIISDVLCDTQGIQPRPLSVTREKVKSRINKMLEAALRESAAPSAESAATDPYTKKCTFCYGEGSVGQADEGTLAECPYCAASPVAEQPRAFGVWTECTAELPPESLGLVLARFDMDKFAAWAEESADNKKFYDDNASTTIDVWNTLAARHWAPLGDWLTHWMPLPEFPAAPASSTPGLRELLTWLEQEAEEQIKSVMSRRGMSASFQNATASELRASQQLAEQMTGRKLPKTTVKQARASARMQERIAVKVEAEAIQLSKWADLLRAALADPAAPAGEAGK